MTEQSTNKLEKICNKVALAAIPASLIGGLAVFYFTGKLEYALYGLGAGAIVTAFAGSIEKTYTERRIKGK